MSVAAATVATEQMLASAATAAAGVLPAGMPLVLGPTDGSLAPDTTGNAVVMRFTGARSGMMALLVDPALEAALAAAEGGPLPVTEAVAPALNAAIAALGPSVPAAAELVGAAEVAAADGVAWAPLVGNGDVVAWIGLVLAEAPGGPAGASGASVPAQRTEAGGLHLLRDVEMILTVELGRTRMSVRELLSLAPGSVVELDRAAGSPADLMVNGRLLARGEVVVVDEDYGLRITEILEPGAEG